MQSSVNKFINNADTDREVKIMNRKLSICIIILSIIILCGIFFVLRRNPGDQEENTQIVSVTEAAIAVGGEKTVSYEYIVREKDGRLTVYLSDGQTEYMETGITVESLTPTLKERIRTGIGFANSESLYDFLESYSS